MANGVLAGMAILSGLCFACMGIAYRIGEKKGIHALHIMVVCCVMGVAFFGYRWMQHPQPPSLFVVSLALISALSQYVLLYAIQNALRLGPLSLLWCAQMLFFVPVILYAALFLDEALHLLHYPAILAAVACVLLAAKSQEQQSGASASLEHPAFYACLLLAAMLLNSILNICLKDLGLRSTENGQSLLAIHGDAFFFFVYLGLGACVTLDRVVKKAPPASWLTLGGLGLLAGGGSVLGLLLLGWAAVLPAAVTFTLNGVSSILFAAIFSAFVFGEKRNPAWYATLACGLLALVLANAPAFFKA